MLLVVSGLKLNAFVCGKKESRKRWKHLWPKLNELGLFLCFLGFWFRREKQKQKQPGVMIKSDIEESAILVIWVLSVLLSLVPGMRNDGQKQQQGGAPRPGRPNGFIPSSFRAISSYLRIVSSGASTVARSAASVASSIVDRDDDANHDQV